MRPQSFPSTFIVVTLSFLLVLLPVTAAMADAPSAQTDPRTEQLLDAVGYVSFETRSAEPESIHYLRPDQSSPDMWGLEKRFPDKSTADAGSFRLSKSTSLTGSLSSEVVAAMDDKGVRNYTRDLVVGTIYAPDGAEEFVAALRFDLVIADGDTDVSESVMVPILRGTNLEKLQIVADELADKVASRELAPDAQIKAFTPIPQKSTCRHYCMQEYQTDIFICKATATACITAVTGVAIGCILACPATGPAVVPCLIACGVVDVAGVAVCLLNEWSCRRAAGRQRASCMRDCGPPAI